MSNIVTATDLYKEIYKKKRLSKSEEEIVKFAEKYAEIYFTEQAQNMFEAFHETFVEFVDFENTDNANNFIIEMIRLTKEKFAEKILPPGVSN